MNYDPRCTGPLLQLCCKVSYLSSILTTDCSWAELGSQAAPRRSLLQADATTAATKDQMSERRNYLL